jgi:hypothetical protein
MSFEFKELPSMHLLNSLSKINLGIIMLFMSAGRAKNAEP